MIRELDGDILVSTASAIVIPVNVVGVMGAGLAKQFAAAYPYTVDHYKQICAAHALKIGTLFDIRVNGRSFVMFPTKDNWRNSSELSYIHIGLDVMIRNLHRWQSIAIPQLGCGLGGLDWLTQVRPLVYEFFKDAPVRLEIWRPHDFEFHVYGEIVR